MATLSVGHRVVGIGRHVLPRSVVSIVIQKRHQSNLSLTNYKRGKGGRSSFSGLVATVFGGNGHVGSAIVNKLGKIGSQVIIPYRCDPYNVEYLRLAGDLGQILFFPFSLKDDESIKTAMRHSNVVINCIGSDFTTANFSFDDIHVDGPRRIARIAKELGVSKFIHFSALNATYHPQEIFIPGGSNFYKSKRAGEDAVRKEFPEAVIFRPADVFGSKDKFIHYYASGKRLSAGFRMALWNKGEATVKQPVFVSDLSAGVMSAIRDDDADGQIFEAVGPSRYRLCDIITYMYSQMRSPVNIDHINQMDLILPKFDLLPAKKRKAEIHRIEREYVTDVLTGCSTLEDLGIPLTDLGKRINYEVRPYITSNSLEEMKGEFGVATHLPTYDSAKASP